MLYLGKESSCFILQADDEMPPDTELDYCNGLIANNVSIVKHLHEQANSLCFTQHICTDIVTCAIIMNVAGQQVA